MVSVGSNSIYGPLVLRRNKDELLEGVNTKFLQHPARFNDTGYCSLSNRFLSLCRLDNLLGVLGQEISLLDQGSRRMLILRENFSSLDKDLGDYGQFNCRGPTPCR